MAFIAGAGATNVDLLYENMPRIPNIGEEIYTDTFSLQLGGGLPATLINAGRLGIEARIATELGKDIFSEFAKGKFEENKVFRLILPRQLFWKMTEALLHTAKAALSLTKRLKKSFTALPKAQKSV